MCPLLADCCDHFTGLLICARHILVEVWFYFCFLWVSGLLLGLWVYDKPAVATLGVLVALASTFDTPPPRAVVDGEGLQFRNKTKKTSGKGRITAFTVCSWVLCVLHTVLLHADRISIVCARPVLDHGSRLSHSARTSAPQCVSGAIKFASFWIGRRNRSPEPKN